VAQFRSFIDPALILAVPTGLTGVLIALVATIRQSLMGW
jgi:multidrug efflux pump subunit AcrB